MNFWLNIFNVYAPIVIILGLGFVTAWEDYQSGKIRNKWIKLGFILGLVYYLFLIIGSLTGLNKYGLDYYALIGLNVVVAFVLAFILWWFKLWAGGDAKLFMLNVFLLPLVFYGQAFFQYWPALAFFLNIILPIFIYLLLKMLFYPFQLFYSYLKQPSLLKNYYQNFKAKNKPDKQKITTYLSAGLSFVIILIFFQLLRVRFNEFLSPYLGKLLIASYFLIGFFLFKPLRQFLKNKVIIVVILIVIYFVAGYFFFPQMAFQDLHSVFALQLIIMLAYFYVLKFLIQASQFVYDAAEVRVIPITEIKPGVFLNKNYLLKLLGERNNWDNFKKEVSTVLTAEDQQRLETIFNSRQKKTKQSSSWLLALANFQPEMLGGFAADIFKNKQQIKADKEFLAALKLKLNPEQARELDNLFSGSSELTQFIKSLTGRLTAVQAEKLKQVLQVRNAEIKTLGQQPVEQLVLHKTFSFAPFMLLGVIITIVTRSSLLHLFYQYILHK